MFCFRCSQSYPIADIRHRSARILFLDSSLNRTVCALAGVHQNEPYIRKNYQLCLHRKARTKIFPIATEISQSLRSSSVRLKSAKKSLRGDCKKFKNNRSSINDRTTLLAEQLRRKINFRNVSKRRCNWEKPRKRFSKYSRDKNRTETIWICHSSFFSSLLSFFASTKIYDMLN